MGGSFCTASSAEGRSLLRIDRESGALLWSPPARQRRRSCPTRSTYCLRASRPFYPSGGGRGVKTSRGGQARRRRGRRGGERCRAKRSAQGGGSARAGQVGSGRAPLSRVVTSSPVPSGPRGAEGQGQRGREWDEVQDDQHGPEEKEAPLQEVGPPRGVPGRPPPAHDAAASSPGHARRALLRRLRPARRSQPLSPMSRARRGGAVVGERPSGAPRTAKRSQAGPAPGRLGPRGPTPLCFPPHRPCRPPCHRSS